MSNNIKLPVRTSKHLNLCILDADGEFFLVAHNRTERDEIIHKLNGYGVAVDALRNIMTGHYDSEGTALETLKALGELDEQEDKS